MDGRVSVTVPQALTNSELRSIGKLIYELYGGGETILFERRQTSDVPRPYWFVSPAAGGTISRVASGWDDGRRTYAVTYAGQGRGNVTEKLEVFRNAVRTAIPFYTFDAAWLNPRIEDPLAADGGSNLAAGSYMVSCSFVSIHGEETLASPGFGITLASPGKIKVYAPAWPWKGPLLGSARFYLGSGSARRRAAEVPFPAYGWASAVLESLPAGNAPVEPTQSRMYLGPLRVDSVSLNVFEDRDVDGDFDGVATLFASRELPLDLTDRDGYRTYQAGDVYVAPASTSPQPLFPSLTL